MIRPFIIFVFISFLTTGLPAQEFGLEKVNMSALADNQAAVPEPAFQKSYPGAADKAVQKEWTFMVFLNAKNNLEKYGMDDINEMETVGSSSKVNVVVELGRMAGNDDSDGDWKGVRRYYVTQGLNPFRITSQLVQDMGSANMGDARELLDFITWTKERYPAKRYALIMWNHGSGWIKGNPTNYGKGISYDDETGNNIDTPQLGKVLAAAGGVDLLASDACLMQMAEVAYEVKDSASFMAGSEEVEPGSGYSYDKILLALTIAPYMGAEALGRVLVAAYWHSNSIGFLVPTTHSLLDLSKAAGLAERMDRFAEAAMASGDKKAIRNARQAVQSYATQTNKDLRHFAQLVAGGTADSKLKAAARDLSYYIDNSLVLFNVTSVLPASNSNGIAVYLPAGYLDPDYLDLKMGRDTRWPEFLEWQMKD